MTKRIWLKYSCASYLLRGDERRDVRGDRRRVHLVMITGWKEACRSLSTTVWSTECRAIGAVLFLRERGTKTRRISIKPFDRPAESDDFAPLCRAQHARVSVVRVARDRSCNTYWSWHFRGSCWEVSNDWGCILKNWPNDALYNGVNRNR